MLYKYVGNVDDDKVIEYLDAFVENGTIYASKPSSFNDPAELKVIYDYDAEFEVIKRRFHESRPQYTEADFRRWFRGVDENSKRRVEDGMRERNLNTKGIVCLTRNHDNFLMWSHYAQSHTGFV